MARIEIHPDGNGQSAWFICPGCGHYHHMPFGDGPHPRWMFNGDADKPTFSPSLRVRWDQGDPPVPQVCHSYVRAGQIQFLSDCTHSLAGQTVDLPEVEDES